MIVITGATGALNGATVDHLLTTRPASEIAVVARDTKKAARFADLGVEVRHGDYDDPATLPAAFAGADQLLLVSSSDPAADGVALMRTAIDAAVSADVGRLLYTSHQGAAAETPFFPGRDHFATEQMLAASGLPWTSFRNGFYLHSLQWLLGQWRETGVVSVPGDGPVSWTAREDEAAGQAIVLSALASGAGSFDGPLTFTGSEAPTFAAVTDELAAVAGRPVAFEPLDEDAWVTARVAAGQPEGMVRFLLGMYQASAQGFFAGTSPLLGDLLGRAPQTVRDELQRQVSGA
jgi:NAD(P)H dehydrogenase (quinone)